MWKLSTPLTEADRHDMPVPLAYVCILDNHPKRPYSRDWLPRRVASDPVDDRIELLFVSHRAAPQTTT